jgi:iron complex transport system ATP-binding protein
MIAEAKNATFSYDGTGNVFENVAFSVNSGEILSILGPNGCGKSTLLKCINGLLRLKSGEVYFDSKGLGSLKTATIGRKIGYVPQNQGNTFPYTVLEMVLMGRAPHLGLFSFPGPRDIAIAKEAIETLGLAHLTDRRCSQISGGEAQLVVIARALAAEPSMLLLDEPTSHLDFKNQTVILNILEKLAKEKKVAIIMTTHFPDHALAISQKALLLSKRTDSLVGNVDEVITEDTLQSIFGLRVRIVSVKEGNENLKLVVPLRKAL